MTKEELFYTEVFSPDYLRKFKVKKLLFDGRTKYQHVECFSNALLGKVLFLDKKIQSAEVDECVPHSQAGPTGRLCFRSEAHGDLLWPPKKQTLLTWKRTMSKKGSTRGILWD